MSTRKGRAQLFFVCIFLVVALLVLQRDPADAESESPQPGTVKIINMVKDDEDLRVDKKEHYILIKSAEVEFIDKILNSVFR